MLKLHSYFRSTCSWRVRVALNVKGVPYELVTVHLLRGGGEQHRADFTEHSPLAQVPMLEVLSGPAPFRLTQSMAVVEYLEERYPEPALLPSSLELRARTRQLAEMVNSGIQPLHNLNVRQQLRALGVEPTPLGQHFVKTGLAALERVASTTAGRFLVGDALSVADVFLIPELGYARRIGVALEPYPLLRRVEHECEQLRAFQLAHPSAQPDYEA